MRHQAGADQPHCVFEMLPFWLADHQVSQTGTLRVLPPLHLLIVGDPRVNLPHIDVSPEVATIRPVMPMLAAVRCMTEKERKFEA